MVFSTLISAAELAGHLRQPDWAVVDCRFWLDDTERGGREYRQGHIAGAVYAHLDEDMSAPVVPGQTGRHPLPNPQTFARTLSGWGIGAGVQVVAYDDAGGSVAARLWWLLRWLGHGAVAVLDGGWQKWKGAGLPVRGGVEIRVARAFVPAPAPDMVVTTAEVLARRAGPSFRLLDARSAARYRGEHEPIDPVAGRIPGAVCAPYEDNLDSEGCFLPPAVLRARFEALLGGVPPAQAAVYCGSGVTAAHNALAMAHAGLGDVRLYAGSWSEWITDPARPVATG